MRGLNVSEFRRHCFTLLENLPQEGIVITRRGKPLARIVPLRGVREGKRIVLPLLKAKGQAGALCPNTETPYDLVFD